NPSRVRLVGLEEHHLVKAFRVVLDVHARSGPDLEHAAARLLEQLPSLGAELAFSRRLQSVEEPGPEVAGLHSVTAAVARRTGARAISPLSAVPESGADASRAASSATSQGIGATPARPILTSAPKRAAATPTIGNDQRLRSIAFR